MGEHSDRKLCENWAEADPRICDAIEGGWCDVDSYGAVSAHRQGELIGAVTVWPHP